MYEKWLFRDYNLQLSQMGQDAYIKSYTSYQLVAELMTLNRNKKLWHRAVSQRHSCLNVVCTLSRTQANIPAPTMRATRDYLKSSHLSFDCFRHQLKTLLFCKY